MDQVSSHSLSNLLDTAGWSSSEVKWRREMWAVLESLNDLERLVADVRTHCHITGSMMEGLGQEFLKSDKDIMQCHKQVRVISHISDWLLQPGVRTLLTDTAGVHPGYCRLRLMREDRPTFKSVHSKCRGTKKYYGSLVLDHSYFRPIVFSHPHGPAQTSDDGHGYETDEVDCFRAPWPVGCREWTRRNRPSNFPPQECVHRAELNGIHVVPVGYRFNSKIEWRFSFSFLELEMIRMWPNVAIKCYAALKLLKKGIVKQLPDMADTLTSYHLKTTMFWLMEEHGTEYWDSAGLMECVFICLSRLHACLCNSFMPHYFFREHNIFDLESGEKQKQYLIDKLHEWMSNMKLLYQELLSILNEHNCDLSNHVAMERVHLHCKFISSIQFALSVIIRWVFSKNLNILVSNLYRTRERLQLVVMNSDQEVAATVRYVMNVLTSICGTCILSSIRKTNIPNIQRFRLYRLVRQMVNGSAVDSFTELRRVNFYYQIADYQRAIKLIEFFCSTEYSSKIIDTGAFPRSIDLSPQHAMTLASYDSPYEAYRAVISPFQRFYYEEINAIPHVLQYEFFKAIKPPRNHVDFKKNVLVKNVFVDPDVMTYYLQYLCYHQMGEHTRAKVALCHLERIARGGSIYYKQTALNVLGHCYQTQGRFRRAVGCFVESICIEPASTVATLHIAISIRKVLELRRRRQTIVLVIFQTIIILISVMLIWNY